VGKFHKRLDDSQEEEKMLKTINQEYKSEGNDWNCQYEYLEVRMELTKSIEETLLQELLQEIHIFF
jgi:inhibitor of KinA sporulation pathway (predicted exonuclease)